MSPAKKRSLDSLGSPEGENIGENIYLDITVKIYRISISSLCGHEPHRPRTPVGAGFFYLKHIFPQ